jgi:hypothetical protein
MIQMYIASGSTPLWEAMVFGAYPDRDLWLWEDDDEECIQAFIKDHSPHLVPDMPVVDWDKACHALGEHQLESRPIDGPLSHLAPQTRLRFISWLIVAEIGRKEHLLQAGEIGSLEELIAWWGSSMVVDYDEEPCGLCGVSDLLKIWLETILEVYMLDDLWSIPWYAECSCFKR